MGTFSKWPLVSVLKGEEKAYLVMGQKEGYNRNIVSINLKDKPG